MNISEYLKPEHGYPLLVIVYANIMLYYLIMKVVGYRKKKNIKYPTLYHKTDDVFNCYQRAHYNTLEWLPTFYSLFVPAALVYPVISSALGFVYVTSRFLYAWGYYTGDPKNREWGAWGVLTIAALFMMVIYITACQFGLM